MMNVAEQPTRSSVGLTVATGCVAAVLGTASVLGAVYYWIELL
jgi:hypothetical protein